MKLSVGQDEFKPRPEPARWKCIEVHCLQHPITIKRIEFWAYPSRWRRCISCKDYELVKVHVESTNSLPRLMQKGEMVEFKFCQTAELCKLCDSQVLYLVLHYGPDKTLMERLPPGALQDFMSPFREQ